MRTVGKVVAVFCHPDDEIPIAGTLCRLRERGYEQRLVFLSSGGRGGAAPAAREEEARAALNCLQIDPRCANFSDMPDTELRCTTDVIAHLERLGEECDIALIPYEFDDHQDHWRVHHACRAAFRRIRTILEYEAPSCPSSFSPNMFVDIEAHLEAKLGAARAHQSQRDRAYMSPEVLRALAAVRGLQGRVDAAEGFVVRRLSLPLPFGAATMCRCGGRLSP